MQIDELKAIIKQAVMEAMQENKNEINIEIPKERKRKMYSLHICPICGKQTKGLKLHHYAVHTLAGQDRYRKILSKARAANPFYANNKELIQ